MHTWDCKNSSLWVYSTTSEDGIKLLCCVLAKHIPSKDRGVNYVLPTRMTCPMEAGLQKTLPGASRL
jgi:hypothetical protein